VSARFWPILVTLAMSLVSAAATSDSRDLASIERKLDHLAANGRSPHPIPTPTVFTEPEVNAYLASDEVQLPLGVEAVKLEGEAGVITGNAHVDFDRVREGIHSSNPLLSMFTGIHDVVVVVHAHGENRIGYVHVDSVSLDGIQVPGLVLELFVEKFLTPKHPEIGIDSQFPLPDRIASATVGNHALTLIQK
jgi:hypothetical protein